MCYRLERLTLAVIDGNWRVKRHRFNCLRRVESGTWLHVRKWTFKPGGAESRLSECDA